MRHCRTGPGIIRLAVMGDIGLPLSLGSVEDLLHGRGIEGSHEAARFGWRPFGLLFAAGIRQRRAQQLRLVICRRWHLDEVLLEVNGVQHHLRRAVDHKGEGLEAFASKHRDKGRP